MQETIKQGVKRQARTFPVAEVFGPTIQGEGPDAGVPTYFVRLGGCDFRCSWCDSMHSVEPAAVRKLERLEAWQICERLLALPQSARMVVISGGNPALHQLAELVPHLRGELGLKVSVETQGSVWREWLLGVDRLVVSPKPPSSGMVSPKHSQQFEHFMASWRYHYSPLLDKVALKVVVFDQADLEWARGVHLAYPDVPFFLSAGSPVVTPPTRQTITSMRSEICDRYAWLCEQVAVDAKLANVKVLPQLHALAWGARLGV